MLKMTGKSGTGQACAACKYQRRKCSADCPLAPYFPPDHPKLFLNAHKLFGVSNILRILRQVDDSQKKDAMKSIIYQSNAREKDPVHGCFGIIVMLQSRVERLRQELELVKSQIMFLQQLYAGPSNAAYDFPTAPPPQQQMQTLGCSHANWTCSCIPSTPYDVHALYRQHHHQQCYDSRISKLIEYEQRQVYSDSREAYESSAESSLKESQSMEHVAEHELKSAAALFTLTNEH
ncbi:LOB domain-containing protein 25 isoform X1 [Cryptomeria japonica]|uniref:LOB domain-containing protein 25 isoform X1 n=2 Tax=Cryptomeria japonica TaxID=3369 RepID=UPI0025AC3BC4|nr:LOB domain-containing protein 25 isoform X1 [Cryptomeria japonica]